MDRDNGVSQGEGRSLRQSVLASTVDFNIG